MGSPFYVPCHDPVPPRPTLTRSHKSARLPSIEELTAVHLKPTHQKHHCLPPSDLHDCISRVHPKGVVRERQWCAIQLRCQTHPEEATRLDRRGRSCLHAACAKKPPLAAVHALVKASGETTLLETDNHGRTPLHISISSNASLEVIRFLLESEPRAAGAEDHLSRLPLHSACIGYDHGQIELVQLLLNVNSLACSHESQSGRVPLQMAIEVGAPAEVIDPLVQTDPETVELNGCGMNSLFMAIQQNSPLPVIQALVRARPQVTSSHDEGGAYPLRRAVQKQLSTPILECLCTSQEIVLEANNHMKNTVLHRAFECGTIPREAMVRLMVTTAPQVSTQACCSGHTPLTLACQRYIQLKKRQDVHAESMFRVVSVLLRAAYYHEVYPDIQGLLKTDEFVVHAAVSTLLPKKVVMTALELHPEQARVIDCNGNYPLLLALGGPYDESKRVIVMKLLQHYPEAASFVSGDGQLPLSVAARSWSIHPEIIAGLVQANPAALRQLDPHLTLYPFQLAALEKNSMNHAQSVHPRIRKEWEKSVDQDLMQMSIIFRLILAAPDVVGLLR